MACARRDLLILSRESEARPYATQKNSVYLHYSMHERELRASLAAVGPLMPVLIWRGRVVDGEKRDRICGELGLVAHVRTLHSIAEVCSALWAVHPERAVAEALAAGAAGVQSIADLCSARVAEVAGLLAANSKRNAKSKRAPRRSRSQKQTLIQVWTEPQLKHYVQSVGAELGLDLSSTIRVAAWEFVQRNSARAALEGSERAPAREWVKPPERRRLRAS